MDPVADVGRSRLITTVLVTSHGNDNVWVTSMMIRMDTRCSVTLRLPSLCFVYIERLCLGFESTVSWLDYFCGDI
ncbi:Uncharacterized protein HZ326_6593 [Fusarium oxysporum f. sp. albedinis]|nr:Uncharacterized protein HZ326_6593 [Fusarium oxysporum f. sp. albedinis]